MRKILAAVLGALGWLENIFCSIALMPLRLAGFSVPRMPAAPEIAPMPSLPASGLTAADLAMSRRREASIVTGYASDVLLSGDAPMPPRLSRAVKEWAAGLRAPELKLLLRAGQDGVFRQLTGEGLVAGVPKLSPLPPVARSLEPPRRRKSEELRELVPMPAGSILG